MIGQLTWHEIRRITEHTPRKVRLTNHNAIEGVMLELHGTSLLIADIFDKPRAEIYTLLDTRWRQATQSS